MSEPLRVVAFDGGGMKGLYASVLLERLVAAHPGLLNRAHLLAGTSTGSLLALGLAAGLSPTVLTALYRDRGAEIFADDWLDDVLDLGNARGADYGHAGIQRVLTEVFGGHTTLGDLHHRVLVPSFELDAAPTSERPRMWKAKFFHNVRGEDSDDDQRVVDVGLRATAAPTYFPSYQGYIDGGVVANNPSLAALALALDRRSLGRRLDEVRVLSIGTGTEPQHISDERDWGWTQWARPLISILISGGMGVVDFQCRQILGQHYERLDGFLERTVEIDDYRPETLEYLSRAAGELDLGATLAWLAEHW